MFTYPFRRYLYPLMWHEPTVYIELWLPILYNRLVRFCSYWKFCIQCFGMCLKDSIPSFHSVNSYLNHSVNDWKVILNRLQRTVLKRTMHNLFRKSLNDQWEWMSFGKVRVINARNNSFLRNQITNSLKPGLRKYVV